MNEIRCTNCGRRLADYSLHGSLILEIKCPKCNEFVELSLLGKIESIGSRTKTEAPQDKIPDSTVPQVFKAQEAAKYLNMSYWMLLEMTKQKKIMHNKVGNRLLFRKEYLDQWLESNAKQNMKSE